jgi:ABC-2 type transport system ATP-binding protein
MVALISDGQLIALATPDDLRRQAVGGDAIDLETSAVIDASILEGLESVRRVDQYGPRHFRLTVDDAATSVPDIVEATNAAGVDVASIGEIRPTFDEVFATLVERHRAEPEAVDADGPALGPGAAAGAPTTDDETPT